MTSGRIPMLDGWRALSILLVLAGHLLPLGPREWGLNSAVAASGMAIFFTLSGFLITSFLLDDQDVGSFLVRRLFRIVPLYWVAILFLVIHDGVEWKALFGNLSFIANLPTQRLFPSGSHLWSLCVEVQFYIGMALLVRLGGRPALFAILPLCLLITLLRISADAEISIVTWWRGDEILVGGVLALAYRRPQSARWLAGVPASTAYLALLLLLLSSSELGGALNYLRPYVAALAVGLTLANPPALMRRLFNTRLASYIAEISYALYIVHGIARDTWLGSGDTVEKYIKRPLLFAVTFGLAHVSTYHFERPMIQVGKRLLARRGTRPVNIAEPVA